MMKNLQEISDGGSMNTYWSTYSKIVAGGITLPSLRIKESLYDQHTNFSHLIYHTYQPTFTTLS